MRGGADRVALAGWVCLPGLWCFGAVQIVGAAHERVGTGGGKASTGLPQFRAVNTFLGNLKYAHRDLAEAQYRFNRRFNLRSILVRLLRAAGLTTPRPGHSRG